MSAATDRECVRGADIRGDRRPECPLAGDSEGAR